MNLSYYNDKEMMDFFENITNIISLYDNVVNKALVKEEGYGYFKAVINVNQNYLAYELADDDERIDEVLLRTIVVPTGIKFGVLILKDY